MSLLRNFSRRLPPLTAAAAAAATATTNPSFHFSSSSSLQKKTLKKNPAVTDEQPPKANENVHASIATVLVQMRRTENDDIVTSLKDSVVAGEILKSPNSSAFVHDKIHDVARGVADKFVNMEEEFQTRKRGMTSSPVSNEFKPLPFQTLHPSAAQLTERSDPSPNSDFRPLPFQTMHPSAPHAERQAHAPIARSPVQNDWLADSDDVSGAAQTSNGAPTHASPSEDACGLRVTGDVPHLDVAEAMEDTSVDEVGRGEQTNRDYTASTPTFSSHVNHRNKSIDHDHGYGVMTSAEQEEQIATEIPTVNSTASNALEPEAARAAPGGTMEDLACVDDPFVVNENLQPSSGYAVGEHQIALGQAALRARFTQGDGSEVSINPGADATIQSSRKYRPRP